ncbi:hypothetical protein ACSSNL_18215 [Thalassobius sp. S69A]|uniref:hypothetical protein n=1 Tax=unclassified Thalassovita TaxID=2619711 RepID=UPI000C1198AF|nr:hypothetical protein [Paracoccaceae bacterium]MBA86359.1 hypothetical protein [Paracoccaceae bacterium]MBT26892.1 hypothetical protein [Paracoccaceae bacterium]
MSHPFIIWTMRRTGGTSLATLLMKLSEHPGTQHEPFNADRALGHVLTAWQQDRDVPAMRGAIRQALARTPTIKHCYELMPLKLNRALLQVSNNLGYRHIILERQDEAARILSLELAKMTGAWGKEAATDIYAQIAAGNRQMEPIDTSSALSHLRTCRQKRADLLALFAEYQQEPFSVCFEDMYTDYDRGRAKLQELLDFLSLDVSGLPDFEDQVRTALVQSGQNSARMQHYVPNLHKARQVLQRALDEESR